MRRRGLGAVLLSIMLSASMVLPAFATELPVEEPVVTSEAVTEETNEEASEALTEEVSEVMSETATEEAVTVESTETEEELTLEATTEKDSNPVVLGTVGGNRDVKDTPVIGKIDSDEVVLQGALPASYKSMDDNYIPHLRNQGNYGTCWAHAAMATAEVSMIKYDRAQGKSVNPFDDKYNYSESQLVYYACDLVNEPLGGFEGDVSRITGDGIPFEKGRVPDGGNAIFTQMALMSWVGPILEENGPYEKIEEGFEGDSYAYSKDLTVAHLEDSYLINATDIEAMKAKLYENKILAVTYKCEDEYYNSENNCFYNCNDRSTNHAVAVVGWDDNFSAEKFKIGENGPVPEGDGAWLIRNSWTDGTKDGDNFDFNGYHWISYYDTSFTFAPAYAFDYAPANNYDNNYQYDGDAVYGTYSSKEPEGNIKAANVFTAHAKDIDGEVDGEILKAVAFYSESEDVDYKIDIYINPSDDNPESGSHALSLTGHNSYPGYRTVKIANESDYVRLAEGDKYSVVVELIPTEKTDIDHASIGIEGIANEWYVGRPGVAAGTSFLYDEQAWTDMSEADGLGNFRIKAYTDNIKDDATYTVTYKNGDTVVKTATVSYGNEFGEMPVLEPVEGYVFDGWCTEDGSEVVANSRFIGNADLVLTAKWVAASITVSFDVNGGAALPAESLTKTVSYKEAFGELPTPTNGKKVFKGWFIDNGPYVDADTICYETENITLFASWGDSYVVEKPYIIMDNYNWAIGTSTNTNTINEGTSFSLATSTRGATIFYTLDGTNPEVKVDEKNAYVAGNESTKEFTGEITPSVGITYVKAIAVKADYENSDVMSFRLRVVANAADWGDVNKDDALKKGYKTPDKIPEGIWTAGIYDADYTGEAIKWDGFRVYDHKTRLVEGRDYSVAYANNIKAGTAKVTITFKNGHSGKKIETFTINKLSLGDGTVEGNSNKLTALNISLANNNKVQKGTTYVAYALGGKAVVLKKGVDFVYEYPETGAGAYKEDGEYQVKIVGKGNYDGVAIFTEYITSEKKNLSKLTFAKIADKELTGEDVVLSKNEIKITDKTVKPNKVLRADEFDIIGYLNNDEAGIATVVVEAADDSNYCGCAVLTYKIKGIDIAKTNVVGKIKSYAYTGSEIQQNLDDFHLEYTPGGAKPITLTGDDYYITYANNVDAGTNKATITFYGKGKYVGKMTKKFSITKAVITDKDIEIGESFTYTKGGVKPDVTITFNDSILEKGIDYTLSYTGNTAVNDGSNAKKMPTVTIVPKGNYSNGGKALKKTFVITPGDLGADGLRMEAKDVVYTGKAGKHKTTFSIYDSNGSKLTTADYDNKTVVYTYVGDYTVTQMDGKTKTKEVERHDREEVEAEDIVPAGTEILISVYGKGNYNKDTAIVGQYTIVKADLAKAVVTVNPKVRDYTGREIRPTKKDITVTIKTVVNGKSQTVTLTPKDYDIVEYSNNIKPGTAKIVLSGNGEYGGSKTATFTIKKKAH